MKALDSARAVWTLVLTVGMALTSCVAQVRTPDLRSLTSKEPNTATQAKVQALYSQLPLHFEPNQGQTDEQVKFLSRGSGYTLFLTPTEVVLALTETRGHGDAETQRHEDTETVTASPPRPVAASQSLPLSNPHSPRPRFGGEGQGEGAVLRMQLVGANPEPQVVGLEELPGKSNYFIGNDPSKWRIDIPHYAKVKYEGLYPGIDLIYYGNQRQLEYDFVVTPGADPKVIRLAFDGLVRIDDNGDLILHTSGGELRLHKPRIYQEINGVKRPISCGYVLLSP